jgi:hypothetical protein
MTYILYQLPNEPVATVSPSGEVPIEQLIPMVVPAGANYKLVETVPVYDSTVYFLELTPEGSEEPYVILPLPLTQSKASYTSEVKAKAYSILQPTDWLVVRQVENSAEIPTDWNTWREDIRLESQDKVAAIDACEDADALETYVTSEAYSFWPPEPTTPKL